MPKDAHEMSENEIRERILTLAFGGDERLFIAFYRKLQHGLPQGTGIVLRGSVITNKRHEDGAPFDSKGRNTSDISYQLRKICLDRPVLGCMLGPRRPSNSNESHRRLNKDFHGETTPMSPLRSSTQRRR